MNVYWYYAVKGQRTGPISWDGIRQAVESGQLGADDLVWTSSFGSEWRKASTLTGLFPPPDSTEATSPSDPPRIEIVFSDDAFQSPFAPSERPADGGTVETLPRQPIVCLASLSRAWQNTKAILFATFSLKRWFFLAVCLMLTMLGTSNPLGGLFTPNDGDRSTAQIKRMGLESVTTSGLFAMDLTFGQPADASIDAKFLLPLLGKAMRETSVALIQWISQKEHRSQAIMALLGLLLMYGIGAWFTARGNTMLLARLYRPDDFIFSTWVESDSSSATLFRGLLCIKLLGLAAVLGTVAWAILHLAAVPEAEAVPAELVTNVFLKVLLVTLANALILGYIKDFVTPFIVLGGHRFLPALAAALRGMGIWFIRYLMLLAGAYLLLTTLLVMIGLHYGQGTQVSLILLFSSPLLGSMLTLPLHLLRRFWTLDIVFSLRPALRIAVPKRRIIRIVK